MNTTLSLRQAFTSAWSIFKEHWKFFIGSGLIIFFISGFFGSLADGPYRGIEPTSGLLILLGTLVRIWLNFNLLIITLRIFDGEKPKWSDLFLWREETFSYVGTSVLYAVIILLGLLAFIVPGIYFAVKYCFYGLLIADKKVSTFDALKMSAQLSVGVKWPIIVFSLISFVLTILGLMALGIGLLVASPLVSLAFISIYRSLGSQIFDLAPVPIGGVSVVTTAPVESKVAEVTDTKTAETVVAPVTEKPAEKRPEKNEAPKPETIPTPPTPPAA